MLLTPGVNAANAPKDKMNSPRSPGLQLNYSQREAMLRRVFQMFDLDGSGSIECDEMQMIAIRRRELGHKKDVWTEEKNRALMKRLDVGGDGLVSSREFVRYYTKLHNDCSAPQFLEVVGEYMEVARSLYIDRMRRLEALASEMQEGSSRAQHTSPVIDRNIVMFDDEIEQNARDVVIAWNAHVRAVEHARESAMLADSEQELRELQKYTMELQLGSVGKSAFD